MKHLLALFGLCLTATLPAQTATPSAPPPKMFAVRLTTGPTWDATKSPNEQTGMREHSANIARMRREGVVVLGARFGDTGLIILRVPPLGCRTPLSPACRRSPARLGPGRE